MQCHRCAWDQTPYSVPMRVVHCVRDLSNSLGGVVVPTMGALHAGHAALIHRARTAAIPPTHLSTAIPVVVWIFVNPTQFNDQSDLSRYPRTLEKDIQVCQSAGMTERDIIFAPSVEDVYPPRIAVPIPTLPRVATDPGLEDAHRPGHLAGVCQVVKRLFDMVQPTAAIFGEKDWQQLATVRAMVAQEKLPITIIGLPTVREADGLAMSSRNVFLSREDRIRALAIPHALELAQRESNAIAAEQLMKRTLRDAELRIEYAVVRDAATLGPVSSGESRPCRALIAAHAGSVRLIDNCAWPITTA